ncbi:pentatricopeptide repeat (PPR) superfamily protein [Tasmannia lanceolata]|uniref:pentatricopeptide repeat (PPR) superfamily protein n=1 Tax=Tasmannia lanceolata TaxID=3420 RepID=UPI0040648FAF
MHSRNLSQRIVPRLTSISHSSALFRSSNSSTASRAKIQLEPITDCKLAAHLIRPFLNECNSVQSHQLFDEMPKRGAENISTTLEETKELKGNNQMGLIPDPHIYTHLLRSLLEECNSVKSHQFFDEKPQRIARVLKNSKVLHAQTLKFGFWLIGNIGNALVDLYAKCGHLGLALKMFNQLEEKDGTAWNSILSAYSRHGLIEETVWAFASMWNSNACPNQFTFAIVLSACAKLMSLGFGKQLHCNVIKMGFELYSFCGGSLIDMYAKCNRMIDACKAFDKIIDPDMVSWTAMIAGYVRIGLSEEALELFLKMQRLGGKPDQVMFVTAITACVSLGRLEDARDLFTQMPIPNVVAWNVMISGHAHNGCGIEALLFFQEMRETGVKPTRSTLGSVLSVVSNLKALSQGRQVHSEAIRLGLESNVFVGSSLINMYAKCCIIDDARKMFDTLNERNIVLWNAMLGGYAQNGLPNRVMELFYDMKGCGFSSDEFTYTSVLSACACLESLEMGREIHSVIIKSGLEECVFVGNAVVDMYVKSGAIIDGRHQFELIQNRDIVSWNAIIVGYVHDQDENEALILFHRMMLDGIVPDEVSLATILSACANLQALEQGMKVHCLSVKCGFELNLYAGSSLVDMYAKCGTLEAASRALFQMPEPSVVSRNALIAGYVQNNNGEAAFNLFRQMQAEGLKPSQFTFASILPACGGSSRLNIGRQIHCYSLKSCLLYEDAFLGISLLSMYLQSLSKEEANKLFWEIPDNNNTVSWTAIISGHAQNNNSEEALSLFSKMRYYGARPDQATFASVLRACACLASLRDGREVHCLIIKTGFDSDEYTGSALVDMYSKCGDVRGSMQVFDETSNKQDVISWNSMIVGFAKNGYADDALRVFNQMQKGQVKPDDITFLGVLTACSHSGLVSEGLEFFDFMQSKYGIQPRADHYACIIDLLGRSGYIEQAEEFINNLPFQPDGVMWATLLAACRIHGNYVQGKCAAEKLIELEPQNSSPYVLLSNMYAASGNWDGVKSVRKAMSERGVRKLPGCSWIVVGNKTNLFVAGDKFHPIARDIYMVLQGLTALISEDGYVAGLDLALHGED